MTEATDQKGDDELKPERWTERIKEAQAAEKDWRDKAREAVLIYRSEKTAEGAAGRGRFNILFANTLILKPAIYQQSPQADVRRRFSRPNALADEASAVVQATLNASFDVGGLDDEIKRAVQDVLLPGRAVIRVRWVPVIEDAPQVDPMTGQPMMGQDGKPVMEPRKVWEAVEFDHVYWEDFVCEPARRWRDCQWVAFRHYLTKEEVKDQFGDTPEVQKLLSDEAWMQGAFVYTPFTSADDENRKALNASERRAVIWECWDKGRRRIDWIIPGSVPAQLRSDEDVLDLQDFFPCTEPMVSVATNDRMTPVVEYEVYKDLAIEISTLTARIDAIIKRLKVRGLVNGSIEELVDALSGEDGEMVAVAGVDMSVAMSANVWMIPLDMLVNTAVALYNARGQAKQALYEVTGISDILRGSSVAGETATAQRIKGNFGTLRIDDRRRALSTFIRGIVRIAAEIIASKFSMTTLQAMTDREVGPEIEQYLRQEARLMCHVDIETDSTIAADQATEQEAATQLVTAMGGVISTFGPLVQDGSIPKELLVEALKMILKPFKGSRDLLDIIGQIGQQDGQEGQGGQPQQPPPDPAAEAAAAKTQIETAKAQQDMQIKGEEHQLDMAKGSQDMQINQAKFEMDMAQGQAALRRAMIQPSGTPA